MKRIVYACILFASSVAFAETEQIGPFGSLNNTENPFIISATQAQDLLNVDVTEQAKSVRKRKGYATAFTLSNATSPIHGIYNFYDSNGSDVSLFFNDRRLNVSVSGGSPSVYFSTSSNGATYQCVDSAGFAYCANSSRDAILKVNSSTYTLLTGFTSTGTMVTVTPERLVQSGFASNTSLVWFSKANDFTTWTVGGNPVDPIQFTITSPGSGIKHITYAHGRVYWFKDSSFGYILEGLTLADWQVVTVNAFLGTLYNTSIFRDDVLYFQGNDGHFYAFDGTNLVKLSKDIQQTISQTQGRTTNSWTQTSQSDWQASSITPQGYLDTSLNQGSVVLATSSAISPFVDTSSANFAGGTLTNLTTTFMDGALLLTKGSTVTAVSSCAVTSAGIISACQYFRSFTSTTNFILTSVDLNVINQVSTSAQTGYVEIYTDNSLSAGTLLSSGSTSVSSSGDGFFTFGLNSEVQISSGTRYWIKWQSSNCNPGTGLFLHTDNGNYSCNLNEYDYVSSPPASSGADSVYRLNGRFYDTSGNIVSRSFDNATTTNTWIWDWSTFYASGSIPSGTTLTFETQTSSDSSNWNSLVSVSTGSAPTSTVQRYIRYKGTFGATNRSTSPVVTDVIVNVSSRVRPSGVLYSIVRNAPNLTSWDSFTADQSNNGGSNTYFVRSSTGIFYATATTPAWTAITPGSIPSISTNPYFQAASSFSVTSISQNPIMRSFTFNWFEGAASDKTYAIYHDNANWWSVASGTGATTNNKILKFNLLNPGWYIYDIGTGGMYVRNQSLYFGSVNAGKIYKYGDTDNDDGAAINSYWKSKDFFGSNPFVDKDYQRLSSVQKAVSNSTMTITYTLDGNSSTSYNVDLGSSSSSFVQKNVNLPQGKGGRTINVKFGNNAVDQSWEVFGGGVDYQSKGWTPK